MKDERPCSVAALARPSISGSAPNKKEFAGALGVRFSDGGPVLIECVAYKDSTVFAGMFNSDMYDALGQVRALQQRWAEA